MNKKLFFIILSFFTLNLFSGEPETNDLIDTVIAAKVSIINSELIQDDKEAIEKVRTLLNNKANVNAQDKYDKTSLIYASRNNNIEIINLLLINKADINIRDKNGYNAIYYGMQYRFKGSEQHTGSFKGNVEITKILLDHNADIHYLYDNGQMPLMDKLFYMNTYNTDLFRLLLDYGAADSSDIYIEANNSYPLVSLELFYVLNEHLLKIRQIINNNTILLPDLGDIITEYVEYITPGVFLKKVIIKISEQITANFKVEPNIRNILKEYLIEN